MRILFPLLLLTTTQADRLDWLSYQKRLAWIRNARERLRSIIYKISPTSAPTEPITTMASVVSSSSDQSEYKWTPWKSGKTPCKNKKLKLTRSCQNAKGLIDNSKCSKTRFGLFKYVPCSVEDMAKFNINEFVHKQQVNSMLSKIDYDEFEDDSELEPKKFINQTRSRREVQPYISSNGMSVAKPMGNNEVTPLKPLEIQVGSQAACCRNLFTCGDAHHFYKSGEFLFHGLDVNGKAIYQKPDAGFYFLSNLQGSWQLTSDISRSSVTSYMFNDDSEAKCVSEIENNWKTWNDEQIHTFTAGCQNGPTGAAYSCGKPAVQPDLGMDMGGGLRVLGGDEAIAGSFPWQVSIRAGRHFCGGALIRPDWVITAAHCAYYFKNWGFSVMLGEHNVEDHSESSQQQICIEKVYLHPEFHKANPELGNDIALVKLAWPAKLSDRIQPICLPEKEFSPKFDDKCVVTGWGKVDPLAQKGADVLQQANVNVVEDKESCAYSNEKIMCAGGDGKGTCKGDAGGPLSCYDEVNQKWVLSGIVSFGMGNGKDKKCNAWNYPSMFTRITHHLDWIKNGIRRHGGVEAEFSEWSNWSTCSKPCNGGTTTRTRECIGEGSCLGKSTESEPCNTDICKDRCLLEDANISEENDLFFGSGPCKLPGNIERGFVAPYANCRVHCRDRKLQARTPTGHNVRLLRCKCDNINGCRWQDQTSLEYNVEMKCTESNRCMHPQINWADVIDHKFKIANNRGNLVTIQDTQYLIPGSTLNLKCPSDNAQKYEDLLPGWENNPVKYVCRRYGRGRNQALRYYPKPDFWFDPAEMCESVGYENGPISHADF